MSVAQSGRTVVLDLASEQYFALDDVGAAIWELLEGRPTVEDVARELAERYDAPYDAIRADTATFLEAMQRQGLVRGV